MFVLAASSPPPRRARRRPGGAAVLLLAVALGLAGCASVKALAPPADAGRAGVPGTVFVADGAGDFQFTSRSIRNVAQADGYPLQVVTYSWSHGYLRVIADQVGYEHARCEGKRLATEVLEFHARHPGTPVYLLGHSAGSAVILAALENLPPGVVDRAVLLSPSLSTCYDVRPALASVEGGLYVFHSPYDTWYLGVVTGVVGNSDRRWGSSSGRYGFHVPDCDPAGVYARLHQRSWQPSDVELGNRGGHYGNYQREFLRVHVLPLLEPVPLPTP